MRFYLLLLGLILLITGCGEETLTTNTIKEKFSPNELQSFQLNTCAQMTFVKPPVDILYVIDNTGSTLADSFQAIKGQIENTVFTISNDFDYHMYFAPLVPNSNDDITTYPLLANNPSSLPSLANVNLIQPKNLQMFGQASGNNGELGFTRALNLIEYNRSNGIFREDANTIIVMVSNGDDTEAMTTIGGNQVADPQKFSQLEEKFKAMTKTYAQANGLANSLNAEMLRFYSLVAHSSCFGWKRGSNYISMSERVYNYQGLADNASFDTVDLCSQNYTNIFEPINSSIRAIVVGHKYDHWKISSASESTIQGDDIEVSKIKKSGQKINIPEWTGRGDGFEYLGNQTGINTRYEPTPGEPVNGLVVKLHGSARVQYPDCIVAKTRTPTEYFGYIALPREPDLETVKIEINGKVIPQNASDGWTFLGWRETLNIKVPGPTNAAITPELNKTGYMIQMNGTAVFSNGDSIDVFYKPKGN